MLKADGNAENDVSREDKWDKLTEWVELAVAVADVLSLHQHITKIQSKSDFTAQRQPSSRRAQPYSAYNLGNDSDAESEVDPASDSDYVPSDVDIPSEGDSDDDDGYASVDDQSYSLRSRQVPRGIPALLVAATGRRSLARKTAWKLDGAYANTVLQPGVRKRVRSPSSDSSDPIPQGNRATFSDDSWGGLDDEADVLGAGSDADTAPLRQRMGGMVAGGSLQKPQRARPLAKKSCPRSKQSRPLDAAKPPRRPKDARSKTSIGTWLETRPKPSPSPGVIAPSQHEDVPVRRDWSWVPSSVLPVREPVPIPYWRDAIPPGTLAVVHDAHAAQKSKRRGKGKAKTPRSQQDAETRAKVREQDKLRKKKQAVQVASRVAQRKARALSPDDVEIRKLYGSNAHKILKQVTVVKSKVRLTTLLNGHSFFTGPSKYRANQLASSSVVGQANHVPLDSRCNRMVRKLVRRDNYTYVPNDETKVQACFDKDGKMFAIKALPPAKPWYREAIGIVTKLAHELREALQLASSSPNKGQNSRGDFSRFTFGTSFGGGQKKPTQISPDWTAHNEQLIIGFLTNQHVQKVLKHVETVVFMFYPKLAKKYRELQSMITVPDVLRKLNINLPFAAHTFNLGPYVTCWFHRDARNFVLGICPVLVLGDFDHRTSGHFIMVEPKIIMELRPGDLLIMMSAILTHGNAPLRPGETRLSWTFFTAGGLFRWVAAGCRLVADLSEDDFAEYKAAAATLLEEAWNSIPTYDDLLGYWGATS